MWLVLLLRFLCFVCRRHCLHRPSFLPFVSSANPILCWLWNSETCLSCVCTYRKSIAVTRYFRLHVSAEASVCDRSLNETAHNRGENKSCFCWDVIYYSLLDHVSSLECNRPRSNPTPPPTLKKNVLLIQLEQNVYSYVISILQLLPFSYSIWLRTALENQRWRDAVQHGPGYASICCKDRKPHPFLRELTLERMR